MFHWEPSFLSYNRWRSNTAKSALVEGALGDSPRAQTRKTMAELLQECKRCRLSIVKPNPTGATAAHSESHGCLPLISDSSPLFQFLRRSRHKAILQEEYFRGKRSVYAGTVRKLTGAFACLVQVDEHKTLLPRIHPILPSRRTARGRPFVRSG